MEYLDIYDADGNYIGKEDRAIVHRDALWHKTVHCWLYDNRGNIYFQIRKEEGTFYTTASGHVAAGETVKEAFGREMKEEIGLDIDYEKAELVDVIIWSMDRENKDGTFFRDRAFANIYVCVFDGNKEKFNFQASEVSGIVKVDASETLKLFEEGHGKVKAEIVTSQNGNNVSVFRDVDFNEFLVNKHETAMAKYGYVLKKVIELVEGK